jgi:hypothetical protein
MPTPPKGRFLMRATLPIYPRYKTEDEVVTLRWLRRMTHVPVPEVIAFSATRNNAISSQWILMELKPGKHFLITWLKATMAAKTWVLEQIVNNPHIICYRTKKKEKKVGEGLRQKDTATLKRKRICPL